MSNMFTRIITGETRPDALTFTANMITYMMTYMMTYMITYMITYMMTYIYVDIHRTECDKQRTL